MIRSYIELTLAALLWGFGFVATVWILNDLSPAAITAYRFLAAFLVCAAFFPWRNVTSSSLKNEFKLSAVAGIALGLCLFLQTWGLQYTSITNSSFITTLYVVIVPVMARVFFKEHLPKFHWFCVAIAVAGTALIVRLETLELNVGDLLVLGCAFLASLQIIWIGRISKASKDSFVFNAFQSLWAGIPFFFLFGQMGNWNMATVSLKGWLGFTSLTLGSTVLGFFFQVRAQRKISPSVASLLFLLESPFGCLFAFTILHERVVISQLIGAGLIFLACVLAVKLPAKDVSKHQRRHN